MRRPGLAGMDGASWQIQATAGTPACGGLACFSLELAAAELQVLERLLDDGERERAARFLAPVHSARFIAAHGRMRQLLGGLLGVAPDVLRFQFGPHGKPALSDGFEGGLRFNLSHSDSIGVLGWAWNREIGVDVESWRSLHDEAALVRRFFSPVEIRAYMEVGASMRTEAFFSIWTRKEAYVKAVGKGLGLPLDSFDVSHEPGAGARLLRCAEADGVWSLAAPVTEPGVSLAVVIASEACSLTRLS